MNLICVPASVLVLQMQGKPVQVIRYSTKQHVAVNVMKCWNVPQQIFLILSVASVSVVKFSPHLQTVTLHWSSATSVVIVVVHSRTVILQDDWTTTAHVFAHQN